MTVYRANADGFAAQAASLAEDGLENTPREKGVHAAQVNATLALAAEVRALREALCSDEPDTTLLEQLEEIRRALV